MTAYYNEIDPYAAEWLRNLIKEGHIAPGVVDQRSIEDVCPSDLSEFTQCHFFAGIGVWSYALRAAGVPDDFPVWTGSCPCQPFSAAGKGAGFADERHLWPAWHHLIRECKPGLVLGEQVASKDALDWLDVVQPDLEAAGYAFGAVDLCAAGVGAPHIRQRLWFVAHAADIGFDGRRTIKAGNGRDAARLESERLRDAGSLEHATGEQVGVPGRTREQREAHWSACDWIPCVDGKFRPVEPGAFPLAHGASARVGRLRAYGNAINAQAARVFIESAFEALDAYDLI